MFVFDWFYSVLGYLGTCACDSVLRYSRSLVDWCGLGRSPAPRVGAAEGSHDAARRRGGGQMGTDVMCP